VYTNLHIAVQALYIMIALNLLFAVLLYAVKLRAMKRKKQEDRIQVKLKDYLTYVQANLDSAEPLRAPPWTMNDAEREVLQDRLNDRIECFAGDQRQKLIRLCDDLGFVKHHLTRLNHRSYRIRLDAAYHLGCMRVKDAAPTLLDMLEDHPFNSALFVIARAAAKCSRNEQDIRTLVRLLLRHNRKSNELIVSIIADAELDTVLLYTDFILYEHPAYIRIGLIGLNTFTDPASSAAVYRLMDSEYADIQEKAAEVYLKSSRLLPKHVVSKLLRHSSVEIRRLVVEALATMKSSTYVEMMEAGLTDNDQRVVYACAQGMLRMGDRGVTALCERAAASQGTERGVFLQQLIEQELRQLSIQLHNVNKLTQYNTLLYAYDKTFHNDTRIYRVI